jgi:hypothetical protein
MTTASRPTAAVALTAPPVGGRLVIVAVVVVAPAGVIVVAAVVVVAVAVAVAGGALAQCWSRGGATVLVSDGTLGYVCLTRQEPSRVEPALAASSGAMLRTLVAQVRSDLRRTPFEPRPPSDDAVLRRFRVS